MVVTLPLIIRRLTDLANLLSQPAGAGPRLALGRAGVAGSVLTGAYLATFKRTLQDDFSKVAGPGNHQAHVIVAMCPQLTVTPLAGPGGDFHVSVNSVAPSQRLSSAPAVTAGYTTNNMALSATRTASVNRYDNIVTRSTIIERLTRLVSEAGRRGIKGSNLGIAYKARFKKSLRADCLAARIPGLHSLKSTVGMCPQLSTYPVPGRGGEFIVTLRSVSSVPLADSKEQSVPKSSAAGPRPVPGPAAAAAVHVDAEGNNIMKKRAIIARRLTLLVSQAGPDGIMGDTLAGDLYHSTFSSTLSEDCEAAHILPGLHNALSMCPQLSVTSLPNGQCTVSLKDESPVLLMDSKLRGAASTRAAAAPFPVPAPVPATTNSDMVTRRTNIINRLTYLVSKAGPYGIRGAILGNKAYRLTFNSTLKHDCLAAGIPSSVKLLGILQMCPQLLVTPLAHGQYNVTLKPKSATATPTSTGTAIAHNDASKIDIATIIKRLTRLVSMAGPDGIRGSILANSAYASMFSSTLKRHYSKLKDVAPYNLQHVLAMCPDLVVTQLSHGQCLVTLKQKHVAPAKKEDEPSTMAVDALDQTVPDDDSLPIWANHNDGDDSDDNDDHDDDDGDTKCTYDTGAGAGVDAGVDAIDDDVIDDVIPISSQLSQDHDTRSTQPDVDYDSSSEEENEEQIDDYDNDGNDDEAEQSVLYLSFNQEHQPVYTQEPLLISNDDLKHVTHESTMLTERNNLDVERFLDILPPAMADAVRPLMASNIAATSLIQVMDVLVDFDRIPSARLSMPARDGARAQQCISLGNDCVTHEDLKSIMDKLGSDAFDDKNRAGVEHTLHRISVIPNRLGRPIGFTMRVGRTAASTLGLADDLLHSDRSILLLGPPGVGKTTALREFARVLSAHREVVIVDTSGEIAGEGDSIHPSVGRSRRLLVPDTNQQHDIMNQAVQNHTPDTVIIDEIGTAREARAAYSIAKRGIQLIGSAHGTSLPDLFEDPELMSLCGGAQSVILGDTRMRQLNMQHKTMMERKKTPAFQIAIEIVSPAKWILHPNLTETIDRFLQGKAVQCEVRTLVVGENGDDANVIHIESQIKHITM
jgi:stage III sporulation protein SpoIIIAA